MKIAIVYKGCFKYKKTILEGSNQDLSFFAKEVIENHKSMVLDFFTDYDVDYYFTTYDLNRELDALYQKEFNPKYYNYLSSEYLSGSSWTAQLAHYKSIISIIKDQDIEYDFFLFTRPDIVFLKKYDSFNLDLDKFNMIHQHPSGNCDDNFWLFPNKFFKQFQKSIYELDAYNKITHEINHLLVQREVPIHYITPYDWNAEPLGHKIFEICSK